MRPTVPALTLVASPASSSPGGPGSIRAEVHGGRGSLVAIHTAARAAGTCSVARVPSVNIQEPFASFGSRLHVERGASTPARGADKAPCGVFTHFRLRPSNADVRRECHLRPALTVPNQASRPIALRASAMLTRLACWFVLLCGVLSCTEGVPVDLASATGTSGSGTPTGGSGGGASLVGSVTIAPIGGAIGVGSTVQLSAVVRDLSGAVLIGQPVVWTSSNASIASVSDAGLVTGLVPGSVTIFAMSGDKRGESAITVTPTPVASVVITPQSVSIGALASAQLSATVSAASGATLADRIVSWSSSDTSVAVVSSSGLVTGLVPGVATIFAASEGVSGSSTVTVGVTPVESVVITPTSAALLVGQSVTLTATARDASGNPLSSRAVSWSTSDANVAALAANGAAVIVTATGAGTATVSATSEGRTASVAVTVSLVPVGTVELSAATVNLNVGATSVLTATTRDANGAVVTGRTIAWTVANATIASVSSTGLVTGLATGTTTVTATSEGKSSVATVNVVPVGDPVPSVTPGNSTIVVGQSITLSAVLLDNTGTAVPGATFTWSSNSPAATVTQAGVVTGVSPATVTIFAISSGKIGAAVVTILPVPVADVIVSPASSAIVVGGSVQLTATPRDAGGASLGGRVVSWSTSNGFVASVSATGLVTGTTVGTATITATVEGRSSTVAVRVDQAPVASIVISPANPAVVVGGTQLLTASPRDLAGNVLSGRVVTWATSNATLATVSPGGLVSGRSAGTLTVTASSEGVSSPTTVVVTNPPVATVAVTPAASTVASGGSYQFSAIVRDAAGNILSDRAVTWSSSNPAVATVSATGLVAARATGTTVLRATSEGRFGEATITVLSPGVATVTISPSTASVAVAGTLLLTAQVRDASGTLVSSPVVTWTTSDSTVAAVSSTGTVTGMKAGSAIITAASGGKTGTVTVTVTTSSTGGTIWNVASVAVSPASVTISTGQTSQLSASAKDIAGVTIVGPPIAWSSSNPLVASVSQSGIVTGLTAGAADISATTEGKSGIVRVTVATVATVACAAGPNQPAGYFAIVGRSFNSLGTGTSGRGSGPFPCRVGGSEGWDDAESRYPTVTLAQDSTAPLSGPNILRMLYPPQTVPAGQTYNPGVVQTLSFVGSTYGPRQYRKLYMRTAFKVSANWQGHNTSTNKLLFIRGVGDSRPEPIIRLRGAGTDPLVLNVDLQGSPRDKRNIGTQSSLNPNQPGATAAGAFAVQRGQWQVVEAVLEMGTNGAANGRLRLWLNGTLTHDYADIEFEPTATSTWYWDTIHVAPTWGGQGGTINQLMWLDFDEFFVSGAP